MNLRSHSIFHLCCMIFAVATVGLAACGDEAGSNDVDEALDVLIISDIYPPSDVAGGDTQIGDVRTDGVGNDAPVIECETIEDCPQPANVCEQLSCHPISKVCVQDNSANSDILCDDGHRCTTGDHCQSGVCIHKSVTCGECGDDVCFQASETCKDCPGDCGPCPPDEIDCQDGKDEDADGVTDCDDDDCLTDARCMPWKCLTSVPDDILACGQARLDQPKGIRVNASTCDIEVGDRAWIYQFTSLVDRDATVSITPEKAGESFRLFVMEGTCNPETCVGVSAINGEVSFEVHRDWKYYFMIEKVGSGTGGVTTSLNCM